MLENDDAMDMAYRYVMICICYVMDPYHEFDESYEVLYELMYKSFDVYCEPPLWNTVMYYMRHVIYVWASSYVYVMSA